MLANLGRRDNFRILHPKTVNLATIQSVPSVCALTGVYFGVHGQPVGPGEHLAADVTAVLRPRVHREHVHGEGAAGAQPGAAHLQQIQPQGAAAVTVQQLLQ